MKQCIDDPNDVDWVKFWGERLENKINKDWDKAAPGFYKRTRKDDYQDALFDKLILDKNDTVLDVGCGEGSITIPIAKKVKKVIGVDSSPKMLEYLEKRAIENDVENIETILKPIEEITYEDIGDVDVVVCSRSLNGIIPIDKTLEELNKIANKYVFITIFGPENKKIEKDFENEIGIKTEDFPDYNYFFNIMFNLGIYANIERFDLNNYREYDSIDEAAGNGKFRTDLYNDNEKELLKEYLKRVLTYNEETEKYYNVKDKADWILIWWKQ
ncbi:class I SAM-dependent methyltransferase [uncultured Methanobrevibacter sp.]|uniref:class I SAM-dependent methyltransferase n=1 Tax=uncultured Methanobrevibacter sp. TaxID=253161 RepID=UPI0025D286D3|nr:class I SAM-dependent methyltransferase [uncultured Methanobrevibacter sp.]MCI6994675.1 class I SAM-dependent methyltransferase [Methanobrevibacter sp.]